MIPKGSPADEIAVDDAGLVDKRAAANFEIELALRHSSHPPTAYHISPSRDFNAVAYRSDRLVVLEKPSGDPDKIRVVPDIFR